MTHWAALYIGLPWVAGQSDCWSFARKVWRDQFGITVPVVDVDATSLSASLRAFRAGGREGWVPVIVPAEGDGVLMGTGGRACHVGIWITPDGAAGVLHSMDGPGVLFTPAARVPDLGYSILGYYRRARS